MLHNTQQMPKFSHLHNNVAAHICGSSQGAINKTPACRSTIMRNFAQIMFTTLAAVAISGTLFTSVLA